MKIKNCGLDYQKKFNSVESYMKRSNLIMNYFFPSDDKIKNYHFDYDKNECLKTFGFYNE